MTFPIGKSEQTTCKSLIRGGLVNLVPNCQLGTAVPNWLVGTDYFKKACTKAGFSQGWDNVPSLTFIF